MGFVIFVLYCFDLFIPPKTWASTDLDESNYDRETKRHENVFGNSLFWEHKNIHFISFSYLKIRNAATFAVNPQNKNTSILSANLHRSALCNESENKIMNFRLILYNFLAWQRSITLLRISILIIRVDTNGYNLKL